MKPRIYKRKLLSLAALFVCWATASAQAITDTAGPSPDTKAKSFQLKMDNLNVNLKIDLKNLEKSLAVTLNNIVPQIDADVDGLKKELNLDFSDIVPKINLDLKGLDGSFYWYDKSNGKDDDNQGITDKYKSYSKSFPLDASDKIKLSNQYGKITVNTWDKAEIKVDVQIKASAYDENEAQKILDGVNIRDSKEAGVVSFRTSIESINNGSWKIWEWGGKKNHKLEIDYTVYMPAKADLTVEQTYGAIELPNLDGKVHISSSYGNVTAQNLTNPANMIGGSYGNLKAGSVNGGHLEYSYGNVDIAECNNLKADLSYGSFKLGTLKGAAEFDLSFVGGFKIEQIAGSLRKLNINASYSGLALGVPGNNNFDFDITTTYGSFNYNDDKVTITSKTPPDGSKHISMTKNYKGHFGKGGTDALVNIHSTYGSVNFE